MKIRLGIIFTIPLFTIIFSCRQIPEEDKFESENTSYISPENLALVNINITGIAWENSLISANTDEQRILTVRRNRVSDSLISNKSQIVKINDDLYTEIEEISESNNTISKKVLKNPELLKQGAYYAIIAFDYKTGITQSYVVNRINLINQPPKPLMLDTGKRYDIVIFSYNCGNDNIDDKLPIVNNINEEFTYKFMSRHDYRVGNIVREFLYCKISNYVPSFGTNTLDVVLKHKLSLIDFFVDLGDFIVRKPPYKFLQLSNVTYSSITSGKINLNTGNLVERNYENRGYSMTQWNSQGMYYNPSNCPLILEPERSQSITITMHFSYYIYPNSYSPTKQIIINDIKPGTKYIYRIKFKPDPSNPWWEKDRNH